jgi:hypothetical protein
MDHELNNPLIKKGKNERDAAVVIGLLPPVARRNKSKIDIHYIAHLWQLADETGPLYEDEGVLGTLAGRFTFVRWK